MQDESLMMRKIASDVKLDKLIKKLVKVDLLAIDDFGFKNLDQQSTEYLYAIVDARYSDNLLSSRIYS